MVSEWCRRYFGSQQSEWQTRRRLQQRTFGGGTFVFPDDGGVYLISGKVNRAVYMSLGSAQRHVNYTPSTSYPILAADVPTVWKPGSPPGTDYSEVQAEWED